jgi:hypothetical protein
LNYDCSSRTNEKINNLSAAPKPSGLQQNEENRTNLALVNTSEDDDSTDIFNIEIYDGVLANKVQTLEGITVKPRPWIQLSGILNQALGAMQG